MSTLQIFKTDFYKRIGGLMSFRNRVVLDVGCGNGEDAQEISKIAKRVVGLDVKKHRDWQLRRNKKLTFLEGDAQKLPFKAKTFTGLFLKDVLHHVQDPEKVMREIKRVARNDAFVVLIEGNRYNPLFYVHMTKLGGHEHLTQNHFKKLVLKYFPTARFIHFESHFIPLINDIAFKMVISFERVMDQIPFIRQILSYNAAIITQP